MKSDLTDKTLEKMLPQVIQPEAMQDFRDDQQSFKLHPEAN